MAAETSVVFGFGVVFAGLAWFGFKFNDSDSDLWNYTGIMFLALALAMLQIVGFTALQIAANEATISYIGNTYTVAVTWILNIVLFLFWLILLLRSLVFFAVTVYTLLMRAFGREVGE